MAMPASPSEMIASQNTDEYGAESSLREASVRRAPRITREQVFAAAWELATEGHRPTIERVRMRLGGGVPRGSPNTVNAWLNEWWSHLALRLRDKPGVAIPALPERVSGALEALWNEALAAARDDQKATLKEREQALAAREHALEERAERIAEQERMLASRAAALEEALALARGQLVAANRRAETLEAGELEKAAEIAALRKQCSVREAEIHKLQALLESERERLNRRYDAAEARWLTEIDQVRQSAKEQGQELKRLAADHRTLRQDRDQLQRELARSQASLTSALRERDRLAAGLRRTKPSARKSKSPRRLKAPSRRAP